MNMHPSADPTRALLAIDGEDSLSFLQGLLTQDVMQLAQARIQFAALLSPQGKILHDMFLVSGAAIGVPYAVVIDTPAVHAPLLRQRLAIYKLRAKVTISDISTAWHVAYGDGGLPDPRHQALPARHYLQGAAVADEAALASYHTAQRALGIPDSAVDFAPDTLVAMDAGYDLLHAISFTKGCYVGQEVVARMHYKQVARKGFYILERSDAAMRLAVLKFDELGAGGPVTLEGVTYHARLAPWMLPKLALAQSRPET